MQLKIVYCNNNNMKRKIKGERGCFIRKKKKNREKCNYS